MILHSHAADDAPAEVARSQGDQAGSSPSAMNRPDSQHQMDSGDGASSTSVSQVGRTTDRHVCYIGQQTTDQVCIALSGPQGRVDGCDVHFLGQWEGPPVCVPTIQVGPSGSAEDLPVSKGNRMILVASLQVTASWYPELLELSQEDLIPLYVQGQPLLTQDVILSNGGTETLHYWPSIYSHGDFAGHLSGKWTFTGDCRYDVKIPTSVIATSVWIALGKIRPFL